MHQQGACKHVKQPKFPSSLWHGVSCPAQAVMTAVLAAESATALRPVELVSYTAYSVGILVIQISVHE
jgi:hypothetical protein